MPYSWPVISLPCHTPNMLTSVTSNEYIKDGVIKSIFVKSFKNDSNILTKNLSAELHQKHSKKLVGEKLKDVSSIGNILLKGRVL